MSGQRARFTLFSPGKPPYAIRRYRSKAGRPTGVIEILLPAEKPWILGDESSIVDIPFMGWIWRAVQMHFPIDGHSKLKARFDRMPTRDAVRQGVVTPNPLPEFPAPATAD